MNEPIEDVFAGIEFKEMNEPPAHSDDTGDVSDSDVIEDPDVILQSYLSEQTSECDDAVVFKGVADDGNEVIETKESEQLLPEAEYPQCCSPGEPLTSETDLR